MRSMDLIFPRAKDMDEKGLYAALDVPTPEF